MKVVYIITSRNEKILHIGPALKNLGLEGVMVPTDSFHTTCAYWEHKLDKWGFHGRFDQYVQRQSQLIMDTIDRERPDIVLFVNTGNVQFIEDYVRRLPERCHLAMYLVDSASGNEEGEAKRLAFPGNHLFVYEYSDVAYFEKLGIKADYCPVGYNADYERPLQREKSLDIVFVGSPNGERLSYLEAIAEHGDKQGWKMYFAGPFYEERYFWKKMSFAAKHPVLAKYIANQSLPPKEVAELYAQAKICLNLQSNEGDNLNPRTFEILAAGGFELINRHKSYHGLVEPVVDLVDFEGQQELLQQIEYYLAHEQERLAIAGNGQAKVKGKLDMETSLRMVLGLAGDKEHE